MVLCRRASVQRIFRREYEGRDSPRTGEKYFTACPAVGMLGGYLSLLNQPKIASRAAKKTPVGRSGEEVCDEAWLLEPMHWAS